MYKLERCHQITLSMIELINGLPKDISYEKRDIAFLDVTKKLEERALLIEEMKSTGVDFDSPEFHDFKKSDELLLSLFKEEKKRILGLSRKMEKNQKVIKSYLK